MLDVLGLWRDDLQAVLMEIRVLVLRRYAAVPLICCFHQTTMSCVIDFGSTSRAGLTEADVLAAIERRAAARKAKDFAMADQVRDEMASKGIQIMDTPQGTTWRPNSSPKDYD